MECGTLVTSFKQNDNTGVENCLKPTDIWGYELFFSGRLIEAQKRHHNT